MGLDELTTDVETTYEELEGNLDFELDEETRRELTMLQTALNAEDSQELVRRAVHLLFQSSVETGRLDFHLRSTYDVTYDEYLMGATMDTYIDSMESPQSDQNKDRRYRF